MEDQHAARQAGFSPSEFCALVSISRSRLYSLPESLRPRSLRLGRRRIIVERPEAYLARLAQSQEAA